MRAYDAIIGDLNRLLDRLNTLISDPQDLTLAEHEEATHLSALLEMALILQSLHDPHRILPAMAHLCRVLGTHAVEHLGTWGDMDILDTAPPAEEEGPDAPDA
jgi:hypothetical protein